MRVKTSLHVYRLLLSILIPGILAAGCSNTPAPGPGLTSPAPATLSPAAPSATLPSPTPTFTPAPLAAQVDGVPLTLAEYEAELARYQAAEAARRPGTELATEQVQQIVLDDLINRLLLAEAAYAAGYDLDAARVGERIAALVQELGSEGALDDWLADNQYTPEAFRAELSRQMAAAWMRDQILAEAPLEAAQIHARQILLYNESDAQAVLQGLQAGDDFGLLALEYDPVGQGDLGWFPRGYLLYPELEEAAFSLEPGAISEVVPTELGFHILQVLDSDPQRPLEPDARLALQLQALRDWLENRRQSAAIEIYLP